ncbi:MAG: YkgJ family cysteine cluster protein [Bacteroidota bacterium]
MNTVITNLDIISEVAAGREEENDQFGVWLKEEDAEEIDRLVHEINERVSEAVDCTACGNCCNSLMINVTPGETISCAQHLTISTETFKEKYIEESQGGIMIINTIPCHFLTEKRCTIYEHRFTECRDFPHLHKPGFTRRLFSTMMYYGMCPIIFNVVEELKEKLGFKIVTLPTVENK